MGLYPAKNKTYVYGNTCSQMCIAAFFLMVNKQMDTKQKNLEATQFFFSGWMVKQTVDIPTMEY